MTTYRRPLIRAFKALYDEARADLAQLSFEYQCRLADLHKALEQTRAELDELKTVVRARQHAEQELAALHREREIVRAQAAERDPALRLQ